MRSIITITKGAVMTVSEIISNYLSEVGVSDTDGHKARDIATRIELDSVGAYRTTAVEVTTVPKCDVCGTEAHYDARTHTGQWGYLCEAHFRTMGVGLGLGKGQRLVVTDTRAIEEYSPATVLEDNTGHVPQNRKD